MRDVLILAFFFFLTPFNSVFSLAHRFVDGWVFLGITPSGRAELVLHSCSVSVTDVLPPQLASHSRIDSSPQFPQTEQAPRSNRARTRCLVTALPYVLQWATFYLGVFFFLLLFLPTPFCLHFPVVCGNLNCPPPRAPASFLLGVSSQEDRWLCSRWNRRSDARRQHDSSGFSQLVLINCLDNDTSL